MIACRSNTVVTSLSGDHRNLRALHFKSKWLPSQNGGFLVCLQPQKRPFMSVLGVKDMGEKSLPAWDPSQNGWFCDLPQRHHQTVSPAFISTVNGAFAATTGWLMATHSADRDDLSAK
jgi:hypothetical protein